MARPTKKPAKAPKKTRVEGVKTGVKFVEKYGAKLAATYEKDPAEIVIPPPKHDLHDPDGNTTFDEIRAQEIDKVGKCVRVITVWSDPDSGVLYVIAGRGNLFDVREVNRRRSDRGDKPIPITFMRFPGDLKAAIDFVAMENFRRKQVTPDHLAREIIRYNKLGRAWSRIAELLHLEGEVEVGEREGEAREKAFEKKLRTYVPLAYCVEDVVEAIKAKEISLKKAKRFGGGAMDGSSALGRDEQLKLLAEMRAAKADAKARRKTPPDDAEGHPRARSLIAPRLRPVVAERLADAKANHLQGADLVGARLIAAYERFAGGDRTALDYVPAIRGVIEAALVALTVASESSEKTAAVPAA